MKTFKFIVLFSTLLIINSCGKDDIGITPKSIDEEIEQEEDFINDFSFPSRQHFLWLSFKDASGNDLLKGIGYDVWIDGGYVTATKEEPRSGRVKPELYTLEYIYPDGIPNPWKPGPAPMINVDGVWIPAYILHERHPGIGFSKDWELQLKGKYYDSQEFFEHLELQLSGEYLEQQLSADTYLYFNTYSYKDSEFPEKITIRLTCPYLFGDNDPHDIVTYWEPYEVFGASCLRVEFEGKEYEMSDINGETKAVATIVLDK